MIFRKMLSESMALVPRPRCVVQGTRDEGQRTDGFMPWIVGIDEAGYGPNLGPLVQSAVAARVPDGVGCLWQCLANGVRRAADPDDGRVLIDDSKLVYAGPNGLAR